VTTIVGPVVTEVSGEKWPGGATSSSLVFLPLPLRPQHNWTAVTIPQLAPTLQILGVVPMLVEEEYYAPTGR
jgi:hypothetical protein